MFPIALDLSRIPVLLVGEGEAFSKRHAQLVEYGASLTSPSPLVGEGWGGGYSFARTKSEKSTPLPSLPPQGGKGFTFHESIIMVAGLSRAESEEIYRAAHADGKLVNVEDMNDLCDFYFTANVKRGDLIIAVSTGGASPTLARRVRDYIGKIFGGEWEARTAEIKALRDKLKADGKTISEVLKASDEFLQAKGWLQ